MFFIGFLSGVVFEFAALMALARKMAKRKEAEAFDKSEGFRNGANT